MGGQTTTSGGEASQEGYGKMSDRGEESGDGDRTASGYGGKEDMDPEIGG